MTAPLPPCRYCAAPIHLTEVAAGWVWVHTGGWFTCRVGPAHLSTGTYAAPPSPDPPSLDGAHHHPRQ